MSKENAKKKTETATPKDFEVEVGSGADITVYTDVPVCEELKQMFTELDMTTVSRAEQRAAAALEEQRRQEAERIKAEEERRMEAERRKAKDEEAVKNLQLGYTMDDGTIFAGISPDTGKPMYAAPKDASRCMNFNKVAE